MPEPARRSATTERAAADDPRDRLLELLPIGAERVAGDGSILFANAARHRMLGYEPGTLAGRRVDELVADAEDALRLRDHLAGLVRDEPPLPSFTGTNRRRDGSIIEVRIDWAHDRDKRGELRGFVATVTDITAQRSAERDRDRHLASWIESRQHFQSLMDTAVDFVLYRLEMLPDRPYSGEVVFVSPSIRTILGVDDPQNFSRWFENIHPDDLERIVESNRRSAETGAPFDEIMRIRMPETQVVRWVRAISCPVRDDTGAPRWFNGLILDVTRQKEAEEERRRLEAKIQQRQRLESLGTLAGGIAHDFNNLLLGILGSAELALATLPQDARARQNLRTAMAAAKRAAELSNQLLAYSGKGVLRFEPTSLNLLIEEMASLISTAVSKKARLKLALEPDLPDVWADATQIRQVVMNLITNASDALQDDAGEIVVETSVVHATPEQLETFFHMDADGDDRFVRLRVRDTGRGMAKDVVDRIFDPFFTTRAHGRGLGLAAVRGIVRSHRGDLNVESEVGSGTSFTVLLRLAKEARPPAGPPPSPARESGEKLTILVIDDEEVVRDVASAMLSKEGHRVLAAADGRSGLQMLRRDPRQVDVVILDLTMPELDGREVFGRVRQLRPDLPVVLTTGCHSSDVSDLLNAAGVTLLRKPYGFNELIRVTQEAAPGAR